jgi:ATP-binding cassette subfamily A (ABC1) protein 3
MEILNQLNSTFNSSNYDIKLQRYPFPPYKADNFVLVIQIWFPFLLVMSYIFAAINMVKNIVYEKENGLKVCQDKTNTFESKSHNLDCYDYYGS